MKANTAKDPLVTAILVLQVLVLALVAVQIYMLAKGGSTSAPSAPAKTPSGPAPTGTATKPYVELFVMSYCPYGTQIEKGILPVVKALGPTIDFDVKFVDYAMHGPKEVEENLRQYCIEKEYKDKYVTYLGAFLAEGNAQNALTAAGLSASDISSCMQSTDTEFKLTATANDPQKVGWRGNFPPFPIQSADNTKYGVQGSPTLVINGKEVSSARDAQSLMGAICGTFSSKPAECNTDLSALGNPAPGFGFDTQGGTAAAAGCGV
jgi:hypothetical protein